MWQLFAFSLSPDMKDPLSHFPVLWMVGWGAFYSIQFKRHPASRDLDLVKIKGTMYTK